MKARRELRRALRDRRRALAPEAAMDAAQALTGHLLRLILRRRGWRIGAFVAADGELDPGPFMAAAREVGHEIHLPVLDPLRAGGMRFVRVAADQPLVSNRFGIPEPVTGLERRPLVLDLVLVPLVAFDGAGNRLGMGAGFYDRCFAFRKARRQWRRPVLLGVAHDFQRVDSIVPDRWDVPLDGVATPTGLEWFRREK